MPNGVQVMNNGQVTTVLGVDLHNSEPTILPLKDLRDWVVWQFPRQAAKSHYAAVRPSIPGYGWYPATLDTARKQITVYANIEEALESPEAASRHLDKLLKL
ncbi:MAG: hypothetical protein R3C44_07810 [Chloroflexota bacterium]